MKIRFNHVISAVVVAVVFVVALTSANVISQNPVGNNRSRPAKPSARLSSDKINFPVSHVDSTEKSTIVTTAKTKVQVTSSANTTAVTSTSKNSTATTAIKKTANNSTAKTTLVTSSAANTTTVTSTSKNSTATTSIKKTSNNNTANTTLVKSSANTTTVTFTPKNTTATTSIEGTAQPEAIANVETVTENQTDENGFLITRFIVKPIKHDSKDQCPAGYTATPSGDCKPLFLES